MVRCLLSWTVWAHPETPGKIQVLGDNCHGNGAVTDMPDGRGRLPLWLAHLRPQVLQLCKVNLGILWNPYAFVSSSGKVTKWPLWGFLGVMKNQMAGSIKEGLKTLLSKPHTLRLVNFQVYIQVSAFPGKSPNKRVSRQTLRSPDFHVLQGYHQISRLKFKD